MRFSTTTTSSSNESLISRNSNERGSFEPLGFMKFLDASLVCDGVNHAHFDFEASLATGTEDVAALVVIHLIVSFSFSLFYFFFF